MLQTLAEGKHFGGCDIAEKEKMANVKTGLCLFYITTLLFLKLRNNLSVINSIFTAIFNCIVVQ